MFFWQSTQTGYRALHLKPFLLLKIFFGELFFGVCVFASASASLLLTGLPLRLPPPFSMTDGSDATGVKPLLVGTVLVPELIVVTVEVVLAVFVVAREEC